MLALHKQRDEAFSSLKVFVQFVSIPHLHKQIETDNLALSTEIEKEREKNKALAVDNSQLSTLFEVVSRTPHHS